VSSIKGRTDYNFMMDAESATGPIKKAAVQGRKAAKAGREPPPMPKLQAKGGLLRVETDLSIEEVIKTLTPEFTRVHQAPHGLWQFGIDTQEQPVIVLRL
jgi:hypothetical protein